MIGTPIAYLKMFAGICGSQFKQIIVSVVLIYTSHLKIDYAHLSQSRVSVDEAMSQYMYISHMNTKGESHTVWKMYNF